MGGGRSVGRIHSRLCPHLCPWVLRSPAAPLRSPESLRGHSTSGSRFWRCRPALLVPPRLPGSAQVNPPPQRSARRAPPRTDDGSRSPHRSRDPAPLLAAAPPRSPVNTSTYGLPAGIRRDLRSIVAGRLPGLVPCSRTCVYTPARPRCHAGAH
ncbi:hypothetical protein K523DRAFT_381293 [Schizophyllum commune Tattone D]|nr:hypothetical protein K523DRAFT_381293 [Schizophyllum commune Tattone D]